MGMEVARTPGVGRTQVDVDGDRARDRVERGLAKGLHIRMACLW